MPPASAGGAWKKEPLYSFGTGADGWWPNAGLAFDSQGAIYGATYGGGPAQCVPNVALAFGEPDFQGVGPCGTVFKLSPPNGEGATWTENILYSFPGAGGPMQPYAGLTMDTSGVLYGTSAGSRSKYGSVWQLAPSAARSGSWNEAVLYNFGKNGIEPGPMVAGDGGVLYGVTDQGEGDYGNVYSLTPPVAPGGSWTESVLYHFEGGEGASPNMLAFRNGVLYGTSFGGQRTKSMGNVFRLTPPATAGGAWRFHLLYSFAGGQDGAYPNGALVFDDSGAIYGTTTKGGGSCDCGVVYRLAPSAPLGGAWTESILRTFSDSTPSNGTSPTSVAFNHGVLYGTTCHSGHSGNGVLFQLTPPSGGGSPWDETVLFAFPDGGRDGYCPRGLAANNGAIYGVASVGGEWGQGSIFQVTF